MINKTYEIREIQPDDNVELAKVIRSVLEEMGMPKVGSAYADRTLDSMCQTYALERSSYFIVTENNQILGGGGIAPLDNYEGNVCELQKMYFLPIARGRGIGYKLLEICLEKAKKYKYDACYLETMPYMKNAIKLYIKYGFEYIEKPMGDTGHHACQVWMMKKL